MALWMTSGRTLWFKADSRQSQPVLLMPLTPMIRGCDTVAKNASFEQIQPSSGDYARGLGIETASDAGASIGETAFTPVDSSDLDRSMRHFDGRARRVGPPAVSQSSARTIHPLRGAKWLAMALPTTFHSGSA